MFIVFSDEQSRQLINLSQHYDAWLEAARRMRNFSYRLAWKTSNGREYLYKIRDRVGNGTSLGPKSSETERIHSQFHIDKAAASERLNHSRQILTETCLICRSLAVPQIAPEAAEIAREADTRGALGTQFMICGTTAIAAYELEANGYIRGAPTATRDLDLAHLGSIELATEPVILPILKEIDSTYIVNTEKTFQARNAKAYEVEVLAAPSVSPRLARTEAPRPIPLPEQEWLLMGKRVSRVVIARDGSPARLVVPDPRWFALQKMWLSEQPKRDPLKRPKDKQQAKAIMDAVAETMPQFPLDEEFESQIPAELRPYYEQWGLNRPEPSSPSWL